MAFEKRNFEMFLARQKAGLTQKDLADKVGSKANYISKIESNLEKGSFGMQTKIARALDRDPEELFGKLQ